MKEIKELVNRIERLEKEASLYDGEAREPIDNNIEKLKEELKGELEPYKKQIEKIEKDYSFRIERLEKEASLYDGEAREPMNNNIEKLKRELKEEKNRILNELKEQGVNLEEFGLVEKQEEKLKTEAGEKINKEETSQERHIKETRMRICKDVFAKKEKGFEDLLTPEYQQVKNSILALINKNPDQLRKISDMTIENIYEDIVKTVKQQGNEDKAKNIAENLEKIKARREELNKNKDAVKKDEPKKDEKRRGELERRLRRVFGAKEKQFEDLIIDEYLFFKEDMFKLLDKDLDGLEKVLNQMRNMKLSDIYRSMIIKASEQEKWDKAEYISEIMDKTIEREAKIERESKEKIKQEEELKNLGNKDSKDGKDSKDSKDGKDNKDSKDSKDSKDGKDNKGKKPYEKTKIEVDTQHNVIVICAKGKTEPYRVFDSDDIKHFIKNGKEYKKDKEYKKLFDKKALKKVDPVLLGILVDVGDMDAAKEYVNAFKDENATKIDLKYNFGQCYDATVPMTTINNYERFAKKAQKSTDATVEGLKKGPIGRIIDWRNARKAKRLEAGKEGKPTFGEKAQTYLFDEFGEERDKKIAEYKKAKQKDKDKNNFKDEMKKDVPTPEEQAKTAKEFGEKKKAEKREPKKSKINFEEK